MDEEIGLFNIRWLSCTINCILILLFLLSEIPCFGGQPGFTQEDREILVRLEATLKVFMEQVDKRFEEMVNFLLMLVGIFTTLTAVVIGFAYWDRRTIIRKARNEAIETIEGEGRLKEFIKALRAYASEDEKFATLLRSFGSL